MPIRRTLSLKREVLQELTASDLTAIVGAAPPPTPKVQDTVYSCMAFISCAVLNTCFLPDTLLCLETS